MLRGGGVRFQTNQTQRRAGRRAVQRQCSTCCAHLAMSWHAWKIPCQSVSYRARRRLWLFCSPPQCGPLPGASSIWPNWSNCPKAGPGSGVKQDTRALQVLAWSRQSLFCQLGMVLPGTDLSDLGKCHIGPIGIQLAVTMPLGLPELKIPSVYEPLME